MLSNEVTGEVSLTMIISLFSNHHQVLLQVVNIIVHGNASLPQQALEIRDRHLRNACRSP